MRSLTLVDVAEMVGGEAAGDGSTPISGVAPLDEAGPEELGLLASRKYVRLVADSRAGALLVSRELDESLSVERPRVVVEDAHAALVPLLSFFHPQALVEPDIHETAVLGKGVKLGRGVTIGPYAVIEDEVVLGDGCRIGPHVVVGQGSRVGEASVLHAHVVLYPRTVLGRSVILHAGVRLGVDGFGYAVVDGAYQKVPQVGRCVVDDEVEIGANTCIDRGSIGDTRIEQGTKVDNLVHLAHNVRIGPHCAMAAQVGMAGSTRVDQGVVFGGQAGLVGHLHIGAGAQIAAQSGVMHDVAKGEAVFGYPARDLSLYMKSVGHFFRLPELARRVRKLERKLRASEGEA